MSHFNIPEVEPVWDAAETWDEGRRPTGFYLAAADAPSLEVPMLGGGTVRLREGGRFFWLRLRAPLTVPPGLAIVYLFARE